MGMAASQARFLGLTARKNNVEYEGQQINQQRTALSNQTANYYNDLLGMSVPVPPSVDDFTKTIYSFNDGAMTNEITAMIAKNDGNYTISYLRQWTDDYSVINASTSIVNRSGSNPYKYMVGSDTLRKLGDLSSSPITTTTTNYIYNGTVLQANGTIESEDDDGNSYPLKIYTANNTNYYMFTDDDGDDIWYIEDPNNPDDVILMNDVPEKQTQTTQTGVSYDVGEDRYLSTLSDPAITNLLKEENEYLLLLQKKYGDGDYLVRYVQNTTTEQWEPYFYKANDLERAIYDDPDTGNSLSNINCYKVGSEVKIEEMKAVGGCRVEKDSTGRFINLYIPIYDEDGNPTDQFTPYALTTTTVTDQGAYDDAMNQYEYDKYLYDQAIQDINAKIEIIQAEDKNLELRLKQLDTEQEAIQTEMEAVSGVIQKNTESSFKTFG